MEQLLKIKSGSNLPDVFIIVFQRALTAPATSHLVSSRLSILWSEGPSEAQLSTLRLLRRFNMWKFLLEIHESKTGAKGKPSCVTRCCGCVYIYNSPGAITPIT